MTSKPSPPAAFDALARLIRALAPEVLNVSFHDFAATTLWSSDETLPPGQRELVEKTLLAMSGCSLPAAAGQYALTLPVLDSLGAIAGVVRLAIDGEGEDATASAPLITRLGPTLVCVAAEFERMVDRPHLPEADGAEWLAIEKALDASRFMLYVQPIRSLSEDGGLAHYEVLVRLKGADGIAIEPKRFLPSAVKRQLMPAIDRWVLRTLVVWLTNNRKVWARRPAVFCLNVAPQSMTNSDFIAYAELLVRKSGLPPEALCFEVTERFVASGNISVQEAMRRLQALGCEVALDDFGRLSASPDYLRHVHTDYFKIDAALTRVAASDRVARATIAAIVRMAESLGITTVAEAVEETAQLEAVRELGVQYAQGYLLGMPQALDEFEFKRQSRA